MYKVLKAETLAAKIHLMVVHAPRVASHCLNSSYHLRLRSRGWNSYHRIPGDRSIYN